MESDFFKNEFKNCPVVYLPFQDELRKRNEKTFWRLLEILGVDLNKIQPITQPTRFENIILPDSSFLSGLNSSTKGSFTDEYRMAIDRVRNFALKNQTPIPNKKIFYFHGAAQVGEERLAEYFKSKGYEIVRPEKLTLEEQLNLLINCESFASTLGSCAHNSIFLRDDVETIIIPREALFGRGYQYPLDQVHPINANYIDSTLSIFDKGNRYHCYIISEQLKRFFGDKWTGYEEDDFKIFLQYVKNSIAKNFDMDSREKKYYAPIFEDFMAQLKQREDLIAACKMPPNWENFQPAFGYQTHVHVNGWGAWNKENQISNDVDKKRDIQAVKINFPNHKIFYSVYYNEAEGWSEEVSDGEQAGTTGKQKSIYGIKIRLDENGAKKFDIFYRVHKFDGEWTAWSKNGAELLSDGQKLNAVQIKLENKI